MATLKRIAIFISGRGSNMQALLNAIEQGQLRAEVAVIIANEPQAAGIALAAARGYPTRVITHRGLSRQAHEAQILATLADFTINLICLAGYLRLLSAEFVAQFPQQILNIHPSLLPAFPGLNAPEQALAYGVKFTGCTVHFVTAECDGGPIIAQAVVPVLVSDTADTLAARILQAEHQLYPQVVDLILNKPWQLTARQVRFIGTKTQ
jgi:phosphoribosylglycinamide formyltransferase 1